MTSANKSKAKWMIKSYDYCNLCFDYYHSYYLIHIPNLPAHLNKVDMYSSTIATVTLAGSKADDCIGAQRATLVPGTNINYRLFWGY